MTAIQQPSESKSPSRRALLAGALGGLGAWAAGAIGRANPVRAEGEAIVVGGDYFTATTATSILNQTNNADVLRATSNGDGLAVLGVSGTYIGVYGQSDSWYGVAGSSTSNRGVSGTSNSGEGVRGASSSAVGVHGVSAADVNVGSGDKAGVLGEGTHSASGTAAVGVWGRSSNNVGVYGTSQSSNAVSGVSTTGNGVFGQGSIGVYGYSLEGRAVQGATNSGYAGYFAGRVFTNRFYELLEIANPPVAPVSRARLYIRDNGSGKTQLCVRFHTGAIRVLATEA